MKALPFATAATALGLFAALFTYVPASAQTVYRCGVDSREYSQMPCAQGGGTAVLADDRPSESQRRQAEDVAHREERLGQSMERDRLARERSHTAGAAYIGTASQAPGTGTTLSKKTSNKSPSRKSSPKRGHHKPKSTSDDVVVVVPAAHSPKR